MLVTAKRLGRIFREHSGLANEYCEKLGGLPFAPLEGYLRGFIDLVFRHRDRYFVVDYKSNYLGDRPLDYGVEQLREVMGEHHYFLQYHLYLVALHRYLRARLVGYDYDRHVGGALYLFVRGMSPRFAAGSGVFAARPSRECIEQLSAAFTEPIAGVA
jgi:exodeoxyribonuclease V beta subunit